MPCPQQLGVAPLLHDPTTLHHQDGVGVHPIVLSPVGESPATCAAAQIARSLLAPAARLWLSRALVALIEDSGRLRVAQGCPAGQADCAGAGATSAC